MPSVRKRPRFPLRLFLLLFYLTFLSWAAGCDTQDSPPQSIVRLDRLSPLPETPVSPQGETLKVAVAAILSPLGTIQSYQPFLRYLGKKTGMSTTLVQRKTYQEINDLLARNVVDLAFVCTGAYLMGREKVDILVVPQIDGKTTYNSLLIVPSSSPATTLDDLRGKVFAFTDPLSNTGYAYPLSMLQKRGETPETFFSRSIFTYSHDRSISAVIDGVADGAAVDGIIYHFFKNREPNVATKTKVIWQSEEFGMPPVVVPKSITPEREKMLKNILLSVHTDPEGMEALRTMGIDCFVEPVATLYGSPP